MSWVKSVTMLVAVVMVCNGAAAQSSSSGCTVALMSLSPCLNYVSGNSSTPSSSCCSSLSSVVASQPTCLCTLLKGGGSNLGITVNQTLAIALPGACSVQTPPLSRCDAVNGPTSAPAPASTSSSADSPSGSSGDETPDDDDPSTPSSVPDIPSGAGAGSKTVPGTDGTANSGSNVGPKFNVVGTLLVFIVASSWAF